MSAEAGRKPVGELRPHHDLVYVAGHGYELVHRVSVRPDRFVVVATSKRILPTPEWADVAYMTREKASELRSEALERMA